MKMSQVFKIWDPSTGKYFYEIHWGMTGDKQFSTAEDLLSFMSSKNITHMEFFVVDKDESKSQ